MRPEEALKKISSKEARAAAREFLSAGLRLDALIALHLSRLDRLREEEKKLTAKAPEGKRLPETEALHQQEEALLSAYRKLMERQKEIGEAISSLPDPCQQMVLSLRYLQGLPFWRIADQLRYEERQVYRIHQAALSHVGAFLVTEEEKYPSAKEILRQWFQKGETAV